MLVPVFPLPGIDKSVSSYAAGHPGGVVKGQSAQGRYTDSDKIRFFSGYPEKIGGWLAFGQFSAVVDTPRSMRSWRVGANDYRTACGTETHLYSGVYDGTSDWEDITPVRTLVTGSLTDPFTTTSGSASVVVADSSQNLVDDDWVYLSAASSVGGLTILGWYQVSSRSGAGYNITASTTAGSNASGGGTVDYEYPRKTLTNPFAVTSGSTTVTVTHTLHGATTGDYVEMSGASAVGGITLSGQYQLTVVDANSYTVTASSQAGSTTTGGGSVSVVYLVTIGQILTGTPAPYGSGSYGAGPYGLVQNATATQVAAWTLAAYGNLMLACPIGGTIYVYDPVSGGRAYPLLNAPTDVLAMFVTPERFVVALGTSNSGLQMAWCDQNDFTVWTATATNTANEGRTKQGGSAFVGGLPVRDGVSLAFTDRAVFQMNYSGDNLVYDTPAVAENIGLAGPFAAVSQGEMVFWMSDTDFWMWSGTVQRIPSSEDVRDYVFTNINKQYMSKSWAFLNRAKREVWFSYVSLSASEIDSYVIYHIDGNCWSVGTWANMSGSGVRTCGEDSRFFQYPMMMDSTGYLYQHEVGYDDNGQALVAYVEFAPIDISAGSTNIDVFGFYPDFARQTGNIYLEIKTKLYPSDAATVSSAYVPDDNSIPVIDLRADGKMVGWLIYTSELGADFRFGIPRVDIQPSGARR